MTVHAPATLADQLDRLRRSRAAGTPTLSVYLDTSPGRCEGQAHLLSYLDAVQAARQQLAPDQLTAFNAAAGRVEALLRGMAAPPGMALALFASVEADEVALLTLPEVRAESVRWAPGPELGPLYEALDDHERIAVLLFDKERARFLSLFLDQVEARAELRDEVPGKQATGDWFALSQSRYARHHEVHVARHAQRAVELLSEQLRERPFDRLVLAGPPEAIELLTRRLPRALRSRLVGRITAELFAPEAEVLRQARALAEQVERETELRLVDELLDAASSANAAIGVEPALEALAEGRAHQLFVSERFGGGGSRCGRCARLTRGADTCPSCGGPLTPVDDLRAAAIREALATGARLEQVRASAAERLDQYGGLAAWTRY